MVGLLEKEIASKISIDLFDSYLKKYEFPLWLFINHHKTFTNKKMTLRNHYYLKEIMLDKNRKRVVKKSTQGGISECLIIITWAASFDGAMVFYVLPTYQLMGRFVSNRFEKSLRFSDYYRRQKNFARSKLLSREIKDNRTLKDIGEGAVSFAGSKTDVPFIELPADWLVVDEADLCDSKRLEMARERLGHSSDPHEIYVGNPTFLGSFLDEKFKRSTMSEWVIKADCGHSQQIDFFKHIVRQEGEHDYIIRDKDFEFGQGKDIRAICDQCEKPFDRFGFGEFVDKKESDISGKHISRLFSGTSTLESMVESFSKALENDYKMQRFYNSELGESFTVEGSKISRELIKNNIADYLMPSSSTDPCIMGVDVGKIIHVRIDKLVSDTSFFRKRQAVFIGTVFELSDLLSLCNRYNVIAAIIDGLPEIRLARKFSHSNKGFFRCFFGKDKSDSINVIEKSLTVSRLVAIDEMKESIISQKVLFPKNILDLEEYMTHMKEPTRAWDEEREEYRWISNGDDHFFFAEVYCNLVEKILKFMQ